MQDIADIDGILKCDVLARVLICFLAYVSQFGVPFLPLTRLPSPAIRLPRSPQEVVYFCANTVERRCLPKVCVISAALRRNSA